MASIAGGFRATLADAVRERLSPEQISARAVRVFASMSLVGAAKAEARLSAIPQCLLEELVTGRITAYGFLPNATRPEAIDRYFFAQARVDLQENAAVFQGVRYSAVGLEPAADSVSRLEDIAIALAVAPKAGPDPRHGDDFIQEMLRFALLEDCPTRKTLTDHMKAWCVDKRGDQAPVDRTIERWIARYWPPSLPTK